MTTRLVIRNLAAPVVLPTRSPLVFRPLYGSIVANGEGTLQQLIYDPRGIADDVFDASNLTGNIDGGTFT